MNQILRDFCNYYGIPVKDITYDDTGKIPIIKTKDNENGLRGIRNIVYGVKKNQHENPEYNAVQNQWIEYGFNNSTNLNSQITATQILKELNEYMSDKVYFVGDEKGATDILMYYILYNVIANLSYQEKEKYLHACRWFNNIQQDTKARLSRPVVHFSRTRLYV